MRRIDRKTISNLNLLLFILLSCFQLQAQELITNGDFETGDLTGWTSSSTGDQILVVNDGTYVSTTSCFDFLNSSNSQPPIAGDHSLLFDMFGPGTNEASTTVTLPSTLANLIFSFDIEYGREENVSAVEIELLDNSSTLIEKIYTSFDNAAETQLPAQYISLNLNNTLASYAGQTINIRISINMGEACIPAQLDNISLKNTVDYAWKNGQDAFRVIGQPNFFSNKIDTVITGGGTGSGTAMRVANSKTLVAPNDIAIDYVNNKMYVSDQSSNRVLRYAYPPDTDQPEAEAVLGQPNFTDNDADELNPTAHNLSNPAGLYVDNLGNLWVADIEYGRVLRFEDAANKANGAAADGVLGKPDFVTASSSPTSASTIGTPWDVFVDKNGTLWVADDSRILRFDDAANKANGAAADGVLGQPNFSTGSSGNNISKFTLSISIFVDDQGTLWVADRNNNRVLRFDDAANKANGADADGVLGQTDFTSDFDGLSGAKFFLPQGITGDAQGNIYITDANNRILIFKNASNDPSVNTASAVLGQPNTGTNLEATTPNGMKVVRGSPGSQQPYFDLKQELLWVADDLNNRVLGFDPKGDGADYFVRQNGNDANDGQSWSTAFATLQKAIESAQAGQSIWVAGGTYYPTKEKDGTTDQSRRFTFFFNKDLRIYGGFNGTESNLCERDIVCNPTILSGDVGVVGVATDNTFHVIESTDLTTDFLLDGFTIQDGYADDDVIIGTRGGAWLNDPLGGTSNPSIYNCTFFNNSGSNGAAMYNDGGSGGETSPIYVNCKFMGNILIDSPARGGAVYIDASFSNGASNARFENCIFSGNGQNTATSDGGAVYISSTSSGNSDIEFTNCSFTNNETTTGGAIFATGFNGTLNIDIKNSILWNNGDEISASNSTVNLSYSIFDDGNVGSLNLPSGITNGGNNSDEDPLFSDADGSDDLVGTLDDDLRPAALSPAYNTGLDSIINTARDIADKLRIIGNSVDRGAHELELVC
ncbi:MAG: SMP-30/gluconolactonase/LRE family protein, partial [Bacteroidota bacterium]